MKITKKSTFVIIPLLLMTLLSCQPRVTKHGNFFNLEKIQLIKKNKLNKSEVIEIFGEPALKSTFSNNVWYYITVVQHEKAYFKINNLESRILAITFDENQIVKKYKLLTEEDTSEIKISYPKEANKENRENSFVKEFFSIFIRSLDSP
jgi:outer membrane protein assembly factor BamE (lipoprotein component of BamABCDE complex)